MSYNIDLSLAASNQMASTGSTLIWWTHRKGYFSGSDQINQGVNMRKRRSHTPEFKHAGEGHMVANSLSVQQNKADARHRDKQTVQSRFLLKFLNTSGTSGINRLLSE